MEKQSKCQFCGGKSYGPACPYSPYPKRIHAHVDDITRCTWCGSKTLYGPGCPYSPTKMHMTGMNVFNMMAKESFIIGYIMKKIMQPINESAAFKMGVIDANGNMIKKPETIEERMSFTPVDKYILKLKHLLGNKADLLNTQVVLESAIKASQVPIELYEKEVQFKDKLEIILNSFNELLNEAANNGLPIPTVEKTILDLFKK